jgi:ATP-binding cassette subfamily B protein
MSKPYALNQNEENTQDGLKLIIRHMKPYVWEILLVTVNLLISTVLANIAIPQIAKRAIDVDIANKDIDGLLHTLLLGLIVLVLTAVTNYVRILFTGKFSQKVLFNIRQEVFDKIQNLPTQFISDNQTGDIIQRLTGNVEGLNNFFSEGLVRNHDYRLYANHRTLHHAPFGLETSINISNSYIGSLTLHSISR